MHRRSHHSCRRLAHRTPPHDLRATSIPLSLPMAGTPNTRGDECWHQRDSTTSAAAAACSRQTWRAKGPKQDSHTPIPSVGSSEACIFCLEELDMAGHLHTG
ncbi:hypothetical protein AC578_3790 [Pseudocercospora eumusae]|uniref:Uncharacterized protein n=1 Tax=Pseudocercospora eumusae TaxID=321146 RepID=A0A139HFT1_9PEZI|nr:hypothetical protein AC578_3790 [Pseudocercospora eumusae]KXT01253.1 hypothetical protein AC578_3790 [Pseudocercospora eumusae]